MRAPSLIEKNGSDVTLLEFFSEKRHTPPQPPRQWRAASREPRAIEPSSHRAIEPSSHRAIDQQQTRTSRLLPVNFQRYYNSYSYIVYWVIAFYGQKKKRATVDKLHVKLWNGSKDKLPCSYCFEVVHNYADVAIM
jgi:hypothetical protein